MRPICPIPPGEPSPIVSYASVVAKRRKGPSGAQTIGGILAGFDGQVFRTTPPPHELVRKGDRLPAIPSGDGGMLIVELPEDRSEPARPDPEPAA
jgi:hypothetical protein